MKELKCKCGKTDKHEIVHRSASPGVGVDHVTIKCGACGATLDLYDIEAAEADKIFRLRDNPPAKVTQSTKENR